MQTLFLKTKGDASSTGHLLNVLYENDTDALTYILSIIRHLSDHGGHPQPPLAKPLRDVSSTLNEIRTRYNKDKLLRIYYFVDREKETMILLNYIIKPDGEKFPAYYEGTKGKKIKRDIADSIQLALILQKQYPANPTHYELLSFP